MIEVEGFSKVYGETAAVEGLSFVVGAGDILGLVGPNGAGKTTTLRALTGVIPPTRGVLRIAGHDIVEAPIDAKRELALVPDDPPLFVSLTVQEHLELTARIWRLESWRERAERLLERLELVPHRDKMADELSRGMRQKTALACALLHEPRALFLDEPLTGLDPRGIRTLFDAVRERAAAGGAVVVSTHLLGQVESLCTRFLILRDGHRLFAGTKDELRALVPESGAEASLEELFFRITEGAPGARPADVPRPQRASDARGDGPP